MPNHFYVQEDFESAWSVIHEETGRPVTLAGIPQTGLDHEIAEALAQHLGRMAQRIEDAKPQIAQRP